MRNPRDKHQEYLERCADVVLSTFQPNKEYMWCARKIATSIKRDIRKQNEDTQQKPRSR